MDFSGRMRWLCEEWDHRIRPPLEHDGARTCTELLNQIQEAVGVGQPHAVVDQLPQSLRQLYQDTDFHIVGNRVFKKKDPIIEALEGDAGTDAMDADEETVQDLMKEWGSRNDIIGWLQEHGHEIELRSDPEDALNYADRGLTELPGESQESEFINSIDDPISKSDMSILQLLDTESLNSPFCGLGYRAPRDKYGFCALEYRSMWSEAKAARDRRFGDIKAEAKDLDRESSVSAFLEQIRDDYYDDKRLRSRWNREAFEEDRSLYMNSLRRQKLDEETIRRKLWAAFDRIACITPAIFVDGQMVKKRYIQKDSFWNQARSEALQELTLTTPQWTEVYNIARRQREWCQGEGSKSSLEAVLRKIGEQKTLDQLRQLKPWLVEKNECVGWEDRSLMWRLFTTKFKLLLKSPYPPVCPARNAQTS